MNGTFLGFLAHVILWGEDVGLLNENLFVFVLTS
tara:strand:- start:133 stop:234 length:102 start_codon:yes stop_codon:yes gene_type:complete